MKFASARTLASLALTHPAAVANCNVDLENLISDQNRSVATYAITTLLKVILDPRASCYTEFTIMDRPATRHLLIVSLSKFQALWQKSVMNSK